jgi:hypothetical protein
VKNGLSLRKPLRSRVSFFDRTARKSFVLVRFAIGFGNGVIQSYLSEMQARQLSALRMHGAHSDLDLAVSMNLFQRRVPLNMIANFEFVLHLRESGKSLRNVA